MKRMSFRRCIALLLLFLFLTGCGAKLPRTDTEKKIAAYANAHGYSLKDYPQSLIDLLERNPETESFVLQYPEAKDSRPVIDMTDYTDGDSVPLFLQWDPRWGYIQYGSDVAGITGCGPVCLSMAAVYLTGDSRFSPDAMLQFATEGGYYVPGSGSSWSLISQGGKKLGFDVTELPLDEGRIRKTLEAGVPIITVVGPGDFTTSGHFLVLTGWVDGMIQLHDPNSIQNSQRLWAYNEIKDQIKNLWAIRR